MHERYEEWLNYAKEIEGLFKNYELIYNLLNELFGLINDIFEYKKLQLIDKENAQIEELSNYHKKLIDFFK